MAYYYSLLATVAIYAIVFGLFLSRHHTQSDRLKGKLLILTPILWAGCYAIAFSSNSKELVSIALSADFIKHLMIGLFIFLSYKRLTKNSETNRNFHATLILALLVLLTFGLANAMLSLGYAYQSLIGFTGIGVSLFQMTLADKLNVVMSKEGEPNRPLFTTIIIWSIVDFILNCEIVITGDLTTDQVMWKSIAMLLTITIFWNAINRLHKQPARISVSRPLAFQSTLFSLAGGYLLLMAVFAYSIEYLSLDIPLDSRTLIFSLAICPLFSLILSKRIRREIMVAVNKHFFADQFDYRDTWLLLNESLDLSLAGQRAYDRALNSGLDAINHKSGILISVSKSNSIDVLSSTFMEVDKTVLSNIENLIPFIKGRKWLIDLVDAVDDSDEYTWIAPEGMTYIRQLKEENLRWVIPIFRSEQLVSIWIIGEANINTWKLNWETRDFLSAVANQIDRYLLTLESRQTLSEHAQLAAFHQMSAFVIHDLKNVRAQVDMLITNGEMFKNEPEFIDDMFITMGSMRSRMDKMLGQLTNKRRENKLGSLVNLSDIVKEVVDSPDLPSKPKPEIIQIDENCSAYLDGDKLRNVLRHLIDNAQHACKKNKHPKIGVKCLDADNYVTITIEDNGEGMTADFIKSRLFKPFETTKGNSGMGLGVYDARVFARASGGELTVTSEIREGTRFTMTIQKSKGVDDDNSYR
jgi:putative PEP-CTERM system histidine kinase